jgi:hypothetical protein
MPLVKLVLQPKERKNKQRRVEEPINRTRAAFTTKITTVSNRHSSAVRRSRREKVSNTNSDFPRFNIRNATSFYVKRSKGNNGEVQVPDWVF